MSNEMMSVPRDLLERVCAVRNTANGWMVSADAIRELRALLAKPAEQHQGEPYAVVKGDGSIGASFPPGTKLYTRPAEQPAQKYDDTLLPFMALMRKELHANVGKGDRPGWLLMSSDTCLLEIIYHFGKLQASVKREDGDGIAEYGADVANMCMMLLDICGVLAFVEQPAPVAVVLPERNLASKNLDLEQCGYVDGWNACLDDVARLNLGVKP